MNFTEFLRAEKKEASLCSQKRSPLHKIGEGHWTMTHSAAARYRGGWGKHRAMPVKCWYRFIGWYGTKTIRAYQLSEKGNNHWTMEKNQATSYHIHGGAGLHGCPTGRAPSAELAILGHIPKSMIKSSHCPLSWLTAFRPNQPYWEISSTMQQAATVPGGEPNPLDSTGLCLLSLDGGGVRGLSTLYILKGLMDRLNQVRPKGAPIKKPCEVFDLIGGTSTGG